jgi:hypothetical protein
MQNAKRAIFHRKSAGKCGIGRKRAESVRSDNAFYQKMISSCFLKLAVDLCRRIAH